MEDVTRTVTTPNGHTITVFENDLIGRKIIDKGLYERELLDYVSKILARMSQPVVLDIGANIGNHSLAFAVHATRVLAFEPMPKVFALLTKNVEQNALANVEALNVALSDVDEESVLYMTTDGNLGASSFDQRAENTQPVTVRKRLGDTLVDELAIGKIDLLKIDVEGHELFVLQGLQKVIFQHHPYIIMEWTDPVSIQRLRDSAIMARLLEHYHVYVLGKNYDEAYWNGKPLARIRRRLTRWLVPKRAVLHAFNPEECYKNLLLVPKDNAQFLPG